jgi:hypothetical protein
LSWLSTTAKLKLSVPKTMDNLHNAEMCGE